MKTDFEIGDEVRIKKTGERFMLDAVYPQMVPPVWANGSGYMPEELELISKGKGIIDTGDIWDFEAMVNTFDPAEEVPARMCLSVSDTFENEKLVGLIQVGNETPITTIYFKPSQLRDLASKCIALADAMDKSKDCIRG